MSKLSDLGGVILFPNSTESSVPKKNYSGTRGNTATWVLKNEKFVVTLNVPARGPMLDRSSDDVTTTIVEG